MLIKSIFVSSLPLFFLAAFPLLGETYFEQISEAKVYVKEQFLTKESLRYRASDHERERSHKTFELAVRRQLADAQNEYEKLMKEFPDSPAIVQEYALFLINRKKAATARNLVQEKVKQFPNDGALKVILYSLDKHARAKGKEAHTKSLQELDILLAAWKQIEVGLKPSNN